MNLTYEAQKKINTYYNLIDGLSYITKKINGSIDNLNDALNKFESAFSIDSLSADNGKLKNNLKALNEKKNVINNIIIPRIYEEIKKINNQIEALETTVKESIPNTNSNKNASNNVLLTENKKKNTNYKKMLY